MAYTGFPATYPQTYPQSYPQFQQQNNPIIWIQGMESARAYQTAPNSTVVLFDSDENVIYIKSADAYGMPSIKILDYTIRDNQEKRSEIYESPKYITKSEVNKEIERLEKMIHDAIETKSVSSQAE